MRRFILLFFCLFLAACGSIPKTYYYKVEAQKSALTGGPGALPFTVGVEAFAAAVPYESDRIVYRTAPFEVQFYHYQRWVSAPSRMIQENVVESLQAAGRFRRVIRWPSGDHADYALQGTIKAIEELDEPDGWYGHVNLWLELLDVSSNQIVWSGEFARKTPATSREPVAIVEAISASLNSIANDAGNEIANVLRAGK